MTITIVDVKKGTVHCPICTRLVTAEVNFSGRRPRVQLGQKCPRCSSSLDAGVVIQLAEAA